jgi:dsRNA-specific ribonuclease
MGLSYECLEFLGDAVLDIIVVPKLFAHQRKLREVEMTRIRAALVNGNFLGYCCMAFEADEERFDAVTDVRGGKPTVRLQDSVRKIHLYDFLRCGAPMPQDRRTAVKDFEQARDVIDDAMSRGRCFPWPELLALNPPKFFSDLVESIIGAIYLDTKGDLAACETFVEKLGIIKVMRRILDDDIEPAYPKEQLGLVAIGARVNYTTGPTTTEDGRTSFGCDVAVDDLHVASVAGYASKNEAEVRGARKAIETIQRQGGMGSFKKRKLGVAGIDEEAPVEESLSND